MKMFKGKNNLDEMQEQQLLHIEKNGFWMLYFLLAAAWIAEIGAGFTLRETGAEGICFFAASGYIVVSCCRKGIWDRRLKVDGKTNLRISLVGAAIAAVITTVIVGMRYPVEGHRLMQLVLTFGINFIITFVLCLALLSICTSVYHRRVKQLEEQGEEEERV